MAPRRMGRWILKASWAAAGSMSLLALWGEVNITHLHMCVCLDSDYLTSASLLTAS